LAKWRSAEHSLSGVALLKYSGGQWNVEDVSTTAPVRYKNVNWHWVLVQDASSTTSARTQHLIEQGVPASTAAKVGADVAAFDGRPDPWMLVPYFPAHYRPQYLALDYGKPGQPTLTAKEVARIRKVLALVKPCQRAMVEFAFPENEDFILFFQSAGGNPHPFGESGNTIYNESQGLVQPVPYDSNSPPPGDLGYDIAHTPCIP
jgi:hypothetical protein